MLKKILSYGLVAGLIAGGLLSAITIGMANKPPKHGLLFGYTTMLIALSAVFVGIKKHRDADLGGVIRFWPAFGMGVAMSFIAGILYVVSWETAVAVTHLDFANNYANMLIEQQKAKGVSAEELAKLSADMATFKMQYANPLFRLPMVFIEIFPVGVLVSLVSAGLLRRPSFLPARRA